jgi:hypothetical protein
MLDAFSDALSGGSRVGFLESVGQPIGNLVPQVLELALIGSQRGSAPLR